MGEDDGIHEVPDPIRERAVSRLLVIDSSDGVWAFASCTAALCTGSGIERIKAPGGLFLGSSCGDSRVVDCTWISGSSAR